MDPILLAALISAGTTAAKAGAESVATSEERKQKLRMKALQRREEQGTLGLTDEERSLMTQQLEAPVLQARRKAEEDRARLLQAGGADAGQVAQQAVAADEQRLALQRQMEMEIMKTDMQQKKEQEQTLYALEAAQAQRKRDQKAAFADVATQTAEAVVGEKSRQDFLNFYQDSPEKANELMTAMGYAAPQASNALTQSQSSAALNPLMDPEELQNYMKMLAGEY